MRRAASLALGLSTLLAGCASPFFATPSPISSVTPSSSGTPNSVATFENFEFVSVQGTGQIFTYDISSGSQVQVGAPYATPCADPSGMVIATVAGNTVMAVPCYDADSLLTLTINANGSLSALGSVGGLPMPYPGIALDGTNVFVPLFGTGSTNGGIAKVSIATPSSPTIQGTVTLTSPVSGGVVNAEYLALSGGNIYVTSGSESAPLDSSSSIQVVNEATMSLVGKPLVVPHSPQQIAAVGNVAFVTIFDATQLESIDISHPTNLQPLQILSLPAANQSCHALPIIVQNNFAYVGCYLEGVIDRIDITNPVQMQPSVSLFGISSPQRFSSAGSALLATGATRGGQVYWIDLGQF